MQPERITKEEQGFEKPRVWIKSISMKGEIILSFSNAMNVPTDFSMLSGDSRQDQARTLQSISLDLHNTTDGIEEMT